MTIYVVRSKKQRDKSNGQSFMSSNLARAVTEAVTKAKKLHRRFYVVIKR